MRRDNHHVQRSRELPVAADTRVPLRIRFVDPIQGIKAGREFRFEVLETHPGGEARVPIDRLEFTFSPLAWGEVRLGDDLCVGVVHVNATYKAADIYDRPKYEMAAAFKAHGGTAVETANRFALAIAPPVVELRFFLRGERDSDSDGRGDFEPFEPQEQRRPLDPLLDFTVTPRGAAEVFAEGKRIFVRLLVPGVTPRVEVRFPNDEVATIDIDLARAGAGPTDAPSPPAPGPASRSSYLDPDHPIDCDLTGRDISPRREVEAPPPTPDR